jgi:hypothetical protein
MELEKCDRAMVNTLRSMARAGRTPMELVGELRRHLGAATHILELLAYFREAFKLSLAEAKPIARLFRDDPRGVVGDEHLLDELVTPAIQSHRLEWDGCEK